MKRTLVYLSCGEQETASTRASYFKVFSKYSLSFTIYEDEAAKNVIVWTCSCLIPLTVPQKDVLLQLNEACQEDKRRANTAAYFMRIPR